MKPMNEKPEAKESVPECVAKELKRLQSEMIRHATAQKFALAGAVKKQVDLCRDTIGVIVDALRSCRYSCGGV